MDQDLAGKNYVWVFSGLIYDLRLSKPIGRVANGLLCKRVTCDGSKPFHEAVGMVIEVLVGPPDLEGRLLDGGSLSYRHVSPLEYLALQGER